MIKPFFYHRTLGGWLLLTWATTLAKAAAVYQPNDGEAIADGCPNAGSSYTTNNKVEFNVCPQSDYQVDNLQSVAQPNLNACIEWCSTTPGCFYGVYDPAAKMCNSKGSPYTPHLAAKR